MRHTDNNCSVQTAHEKLFIWRHHSTVKGDIKL
nr:MAG TPA: hypothetical protein [Caudoviricetes sp.]